VTENLELKRPSALDEICPAESILASNTSSLSISSIASAIGRRDRIIGCHWINPPYLIPLVEVVRAADTSQETVAYCTGLLKTAGFVPAVCKDVPGFVVNRLQWLLQSEILNLLERGIVNAEDADNIASLGLGARLALYGPEEQRSVRGQDAVAARIQYMFSRPATRSASRLLEDKVAQGSRDEGRPGLVQLFGRVSRS
jgi:3-hydroxybutyryl-CoA dehydrogenase